MKTTSITDLNDAKKIEQEEYTKRSKNTQTTEEKIELPSKVRANETLTAI